MLSFRSSWYDCGITSCLSPARCLPCGSGFSLGSPIENELAFRKRFCNLKELVLDYLRTEVLQIEVLPAEISAYQSLDLAAGPLILALGDSE